MSNLRNDHVACHNPELADINSRKLLSFSVVMSLPGLLIFVQIKKK